MFALCFVSCQAQVNEASRIEINLDIAALQKKGAYFRTARILAIDDNLAIGQIGLVDVFLFDLRSGNVLKPIDTDLIIKRLEEHIHDLLGDVYYIPGISEHNSKSTYVGAMPHDYRGLFYFSEKGNFVVHMVTVVFNRKDDLDQLLFPSLVFFDKNLDNIEIIPFDPLNMSTNSDWVCGGFILGRDRVFTKMMAWKHDHDFDFLEYTLTDEQLYTLTDTLFGIKTNTEGYIGRFHGCFAFHDKNYINLGSMLYSFEGGNIKEGQLLPFPHKVERNFLYIEPIDENHLLAYAINDYRKDPEPTGWLFLLDKDFAITRVIDRFDLREFAFCSFFMAGNSVYIVNYDQKKESYFLLRYNGF